MTIRRRLLMIAALLALAATAIGAGLAANGTTASVATDGTIIVEN
jgi:hypothetical protein